MSRKEILGYRSAGCLGKGGIPLLLVFALLLSGCGEKKRARSRIPTPPPDISQPEPTASTSPAHTTPTPRVPGHVDVAPFPDDAPVLWSETGLASWYGPPYHNRRAANGEIFDMNEMTAAHLTLPLNSYVRVTNLRNGKSIILRVNDRGPYHGNRLIDVSTRAAKLLEFDGFGVARVRVEYVGHAPLEGSDDRLLEATLRTGIPAPAPSAVMVASARPFVPEAASPVGRIRGQVPIPEGRPYSLGNTSVDVASLNATSEMSASRRASVDERMLFNPREVSYDAPIDDPVTSEPASPMSRPVSAYAPVNLGASPDPMAGRGLY